ncbi:calcium/sodium antiporter [Paracnuella aquatica]|uniref:calcium/sodium antiporter n=1 Tax=Paracnuella aquatica TaxID=2268757 RepID=UPI000DF0084B|nr:calcium/sodium antiporter [Paracnuella aquatica]RPD51664.1 calcium/sodium antiporter [Paracnuella aquatica]
MDLHPAISFFGGLVIILLGAELVLRGATRFAAMLGINPIIIGLTIVSVGTSMPELAIGITAVADGFGTLAVGNIAGTNIVNILLILGLSADIKPLPLQLMSIRLDVPVMIVSAVVLVVMAADGVLSRREGAILLLGAVAYLIKLIQISRKETAVIKKEFAADFGKQALHVQKSTPSLMFLVMLVTGIGLSVLGAHLLVAGAVNIALSLGISESVVGLTIVAIGTSAPELATTVVGTIKNDRDVAVGNLIGSSSTNILVILGLTCIAAPNGVQVSNDVLWFDLPLAAAVAIACYPVFRSDRMVSQKEGLVFVLIYLLYLSTLLLLRT